MEKYENLYELFGLDEDAPQEEVRKVTKEALRDSHPDRDESITPSQFETIKKGREILSDKEEREKYDKMGHNKYVNSNLEKPLSGYNFVDKSSLSSGKPNEDFNDSGDVMEELIEFSPDNSSMSGAIKQDGETVSATKAREGDIEHPAQARKQRDDIETEEEEGKKVVKSAGIFVTIGSVLTDDTVKLSILVVILLSLYGAIYLRFGGLGVAFAFMFSMGLFYFPMFRKLLSFDD